MFTAGSSFWVDADSHLWFIISDPAIDESRLLYVNLTTFSPTGKRNDAENDPACMIVPGEHPFVTQLSCVYYYGAHVSSLSLLETRHANRRLRLSDPASEPLLRKMRDCAGDSVHMLPEHYPILVDQELVH